MNDREIDLLRSGWRKTIVATEEKLLVVTFHSSCQSEQNNSFELTKMKMYLFQFSEVGARCPWLRITTCSGHDLLQRPKLKSYDSSQPWFHFSCPTFMDFNSSLNKSFQYVASIVFSGILPFLIFILLNIKMKFSLVDLCACTCTLGAQILSQVYRIYNLILVPNG